VFESAAALVSRRRSLTTRLVATAVLLVAVVSLLFAGATAFALRTYLDRQLDEQVAAFDPELAPDDGRAGPRSPFDDERHGHRPPPGAQELVVEIESPTVAYQITRTGDRQLLDPTATAAFTAVPADGDHYTVELGKSGSYRVVAHPSTDNDIIVTGVKDTVEATVRTVLLFMGAFVLLGTAAAAAAGSLLVRRQLEPLKEVADTAHSVAALPLATGEVDIPARVPHRLTDESTEVGQVGAALNTLLGHVESALGARYRSEQQVRQFVADASHELRTPLATIQGYAELARRAHAQEPEALLRALEKVEAEGVRMASLVEDLLLLARLDAGRPLAQDEVDLTRSVLEAVSDARVVSPDHRWRLELPDDPVTVPGDERRLRQVLVNLFSNAARHTPAGTTVTVSVQEDGERRASVQVHDDGPGIPGALQPSVFERFTRADTARTREVGGAGLGLSLARAITRAHGGDLSVVSRAGSTTFTVTLPSGPGVPDPVAPAVTHSV
jgi:two-component system OmpR family sensor kinase